MKLIIIGNAQTGKDTLAELFSHHYSLKFVKTSMLSAEHIIMEALDYPSVEECYEDRVNHRQEWKELIAQYCSDDPAALAKLAFEQSDIYVGVRRRVEFEAMRPLADMVIWVKPDPLVSYVNPESEGIMELTEDDADYVIVNNYKPEDFALSMKRSYAALVRAGAKPSKTVLTDIKLEPKTELPKVVVANSTPAAFSTANMDPAAKTVAFDTAKMSLAAKLAASKAKTES